MPVSSPPQPAGVTKVISDLVSQIGHVKGKLQLAAFAVAGAVIIIIFVAGRSNVASILSTGGIAVSIIVFAQLAPLCDQIKDENLKVRLVIGLFILFMFAFIVLVIVAIRSVSLDTVSLENRARASLSAGNCADGYSAASALAEQAPNWAESYSYKGWAEFCLERYGDAAGSFRKALALDADQTGGKQAHRYRFNLAAALIKADIVDFRNGRPIVRNQEAVALLEQVKTHYTATRIDDTDTLANLALVHVMGLDCADATSYAHQLEARRDRSEIVRAVDGVCSIIQGRARFEDAKRKSGDLGWIFDSAPPPERKFDYLIPAQIGYLRYRKQTSYFGRAMFAQLCCKGPEP